MWVKPLTEFGDVALYFTDRLAAFASGILDAVEAGDVPDVDFIVCADDVSLVPDAPVFVQAKQQHMKNIAIPDYSFLQAAYRDKKGPFAYARLVETSKKPAAKRDPRILWDGDLLKQKRLGLRQFIDARPSLFHLVRQAPVNEFGKAFYKDASMYCDYSAVLHVEGNTWSMRLKNILLCGAVLREKLQCFPGFLQYRTYSILNDMNPHKY